MTAIQVVIDGRRQVALLPEWLRLYRYGGRSKCSEESRCRLCLRPDRIRKLTRHHVVPQRWFRLYGLDGYIRDADANIIPLCAACHRDVEAPGDASARRMLRKVMGPSEAAYAITLCGQTWFDTRYPLR